MKRILVVFTGGTIGSRIHNSTIDVDASTSYYLLKLFRDHYKIEVEFDTLQPINILSENCTPNHWQQLYNTLKEVDTTNYSGIIITHGTDTLPYTSSMLSFLFRDIEIPIVITASNYALEDSKSNGLPNFASSVQFIVSAKLKGVYTIFQNNKGENVVFLPSRIGEADSYNDQFQSFGGVDLGVMKDGEFVLNESDINPSMEELLEKRERLIEKDIILTNTIYAIKPYPGLDYNFFNFSYKPKAILHSLYHSGTGCIHEDQYSLPNFVKKCRDAGMDFYLISFKNINNDLYITSREILEYGAIPLQNISFEAAYAKLNIAYNQTSMSPKEYMKQEQFFEFLPN